MAYIKGMEVRGTDVDGQTRCKHYHNEVDIIAIKFPCCQTYYSCHLCHEEHAGHAAQVWKREQFDCKAVLCGRCGHELTVREYMQCESACPRCGARFNPGCRHHYHLYFEV